MTRLKAAAALVAMSTILACAPIALAPYATADGTGAIVAMTGVYRSCDFNPNKLWVGGQAHATAVIGTDGTGAVTADVEMVRGLPNTHYNVRLIQMPRPTLACTGTDPGVAAGFLDTDPLGAGTVTLRGERLPSTTGAWVFIDLPAEHSQLPKEHYSSDYVASV